MKKVLLTALTVILCLTFMVGGLASASSEPTFYKFNFGAGPEVTGYIGVSASDAYSPEKGYGFNTPQDVRNVSASGTGVGSSAVQFLKYGVTSPNTFNVDLDKGLYRVQVMLGDTSRSSVAAEGVYQLLNLTGDNVEDSVLIPITDGQLNIIVTAGKEGTAFTLSALIITKVSNDPTMPRTVWIGGDSTVANYYPQDSDEIVGWGQIIPELVNPEAFQVRNMASAGQIAQGFLKGGPLDTILKYIQKNDYFLFEMGINDVKAYSESQFTYYMRLIVQAVKAKGATVVLVTPQGRAIDWKTDGVNLVHYAEDSWYRHATIALSQEQRIGLVDLNVLSSAYFTSIGPAQTELLYKTGDYLHFNRKGATVLANLVVQDLIKQGMDGFAPDSTAPTTSDNAPANWVNHDVTVTLTATDRGGSGVAATYYSLDGGNEQTGTTVNITAEGTHTLTYWSVDKAGNTEAKHAATVRIDKTAPTLKVVVDKNTLWPPDHQLESVTALVYANDSLSGVNSVVLSSITSNEPDSGLEDGDQPNDIQGAEIGAYDTSFMLRAERSNDGSGRIYTITYTVTDQAGNTTNASATVLVPHDQN